MVRSFWAHGAFESFGKADGLSCKDCLYAATERGLQQHFDLLLSSSSRFQDRFLIQGQKNEKVETPPSVDSGS